jgi:DNA-binding NarL/FixJ family response regulator
MKKTVMVVEDDRGLREQLTEILENAPDIECLGAFASAE